MPLPQSPGHKPPTQKGQARSRARTLSLILCLTLPACQLRELQRDTPNLAVELRYTTCANITGKPLYPPNAKALGTKKLSLALRQAQDSLNTQGLGIIVFDAYRPKEATRKLWNKAVETNQAIFYAPPWVGSPHNHGTAVDIGLCLLSNPTAPLPMPMAFDETDPKKFNHSPEAKQNNETLTLAMTQAGFAKHPLECWHYSLPPSKNP